jgi:hypothetical protein
MHGGFPPSGSLAPGFKTGRYSRLLPKALRKSYNAALADPSVLSVRDDVALATAQIEDALAGANVGPTLDEIDAAWRDFRTAAASRDPVRVVQASEAMDATVKRARDARRQWAEVERLQLHKARLATTEFRRQMAASSMIEASAAWSLVQTILELVKAHVPDTTARRAIADGLVRLTGRDALSRPD